MTGSISTPPATDLRQIAARHIAHATELLEQLGLVQHPLVALTHARHEHFAHTRQWLTAQDLSAKILAFQDGGVFLRALRREYGLGSANKKHISRAVAREMHLCVIGAT